jgi:hypothetical protein
MPRGKRPHPRGSLDRFQFSMRELMPGLLDRAPKPTTGLAARAREDLWRLTGALDWRRALHSPRQTRAAELYPWPKVPTCPRPHAAEPTNPTRTAFQGRLRHQTWAKAKTRARLGPGPRSGLR